jgi:hypothetical protein
MRPPERPSRTLIGVGATLAVPSIRGSAMLDLLYLALGVAAFALFAAYAAALRRI